MTITEVAARLCELGFARRFYAWPEKEGSEVRFEDAAGRWTYYTSTQCRNLLTNELAELDVTACMSTEEYLAYASQVAA